MEIATETESPDVKYFRILNGELDEKIEVDSPEQAVEIAVSFFRQTLENKYGPDSESPKTFHDIGHTEMIAAVGNDVCKHLVDEDLGYLLIDMSKGDFDSLEDYHKELLKSSVRMRTAMAYQTLLIWSHDMRQDGVIKDVDVLGVKVKQLFRNRGTSVTQNEGGSGDDLANVIEKFVYTNGTPVFDGYPRRRCIMDTDATYVNYEKVEGFGFALLNQPGFDNASLQGQILALCDLSGNLCTTWTSTKNFRDIVKTGNLEFAELFPDILHILTDTKASHMERLAAIKRGYEWVNPQQVGFVESQVWLKDWHIDMMERMYDSPELGSVLKTLFGGSQEVIDSVTDRALNLAGRRLDYTGVTLDDWLSRLELFLSKPSGYLPSKEVPRLNKAAEIVAEELKK